MKAILVCFEASNLLSTDDLFNTLSQR